MPPIEKKYFYDHFTDADIAGMFNLTHVLYIVCFFALLALAVWLSCRFMSITAIKRTHLIIAVAITLGEIAKIVIRISKNQWIDSWIPLYYCSLFLFAVWLPLTRVKWLSDMGYAYMTMGGIMASVFFTFYPSTSLAIFPIWHPSLWYSAVFHFAMAYLGLMFLIKRMYIPKWRHTCNYFVLILAASVPSVFLNNKYQTNCMFLRHAFKLPMLEWMSRDYPYLYMAVVFFAQGVLLYVAMCGLYKLIAHLTKKKEKTVS